MAFELTQRARIEADKVNKEPQLVFEVDGLEQFFGAVILKKYIRIGEDGLEIGNDWRIGGLTEQENSNPYITFTGGTSTNIKQSIDQDRGETSSISSLDIALIDKNGEVTALLKPDEDETPVFDLLGRKCKVWLGFADSGWKQDYIPIFRGFIQTYDAGAGFVKFNVASVEKLEDQEILPLITTELSSDIAVSGVSTLPVASSSGFVNANIGITGFAGGIGPFSGFDSYAKINDEVILLSDAFSATGLGVSSRGALGTTAASHSEDDEVESFYKIKGNPIDVALYTLLGTNSNEFTNYIVDQEITEFVNLPDGSQESRSFYVRGQDLSSDFGLRRGDAVVVNQGPSATGNFSGLGTIDTLEITEDGSTVVKLADDNSINGSASGVFFNEEPTDSTFSVSTQYSNRWPFGLGLTPDEVDIDRFEQIRNRFFSSVEIEYLVKDTVNAREFIEQEIFKPLSLYAVPRGGKISIQYHFPPLPDQEIPVLNSTNVVNPSQIKIQRSTATNFYNAVAIRFEEQVLQERFDRGVLSVQADSVERFSVGTKTFLIQAKAIRQTDLSGGDLNGANISQTAADRRLKKYRYGAEYIKGLQINYRTGFTLEIGDLVILDLAELKISDIKSGTRVGNARIFEIENRTLNLKTGEIKVDLVDTNFSLDARYCLMSPSSLVKSASSGTQFVIKPRSLQPTKQYDDNEYFKWENEVGSSLLVHNDDFSVSGVAVLASVNLNTLTLETDLGFTPDEGFTVELSSYNNQPSVITAKFGFMKDADFDDGTIQYQMI